MAYQKLSRIEQVDFKALTDSFNNIWSTGNGPVGYGQTALIVPNIGDQVEAENYWKLLVDSVNAVGIHTGTTLDPMVPVPQPDNLILYLTNLTNNIAKITNNVKNANVQGQDVTSTLTNTTVANNVLNFQFYVRFTSVDKARYFFNAGGQIGLSFTHAATSTGPDVIMNNLCTNTGTIWLSSPASGTITVKNTTFNGVTQLNGNSLSSFTINKDNGFYALIGQPQNLFIQKPTKGDATQQSGSTLLIQAARISETTNPADNRTIKINCIFTLAPVLGNITSGTIARIIIRNPEATNITDTWSPINVTGDVVKINQPYTPFPKMYYALLGAGGEGGDLDYSNFDRTGDPILYGGGGAAGGMIYGELPFKLTGELNFTLGIPQTGYDIQSININNKFPPGRGGFAGTDSLLTATDDSAFRIEAKGGGGGGSGGSYTGSSTYPTAGSPTWGTGKPGLNAGGSSGVSGNFGFPGGGPTGSGNQGGKNYFQRGGGGAGAGGPGVAPTTTNEQGGLGGAGTVWPVDGKTYGVGGEGGGKYVNAEYSKPKNPSIDLNDYTGNWDLTPTPAPPPAPPSPTPTPTPTYVLPTFPVLYHYDAIANYPSTTGWKNLGTIGSPGDLQLRSGYNMKYSPTEPRYIPLRKQDSTGVYYLQTNLISSTTKGIALTRYSIECYFRLISPVTAPTIALVSSQPSGDLNYFLGFNVFIPDGKLYIGSWLGADDPPGGFSPGPINTWIISGGVTIDLNKWYHVVAQRVTTGYEIYVNGVLAQNGNLVFGSDYPIAGRGADTIFVGSGPTSDSLTTQANKLDVDIGIIRIRNDSLVLSHVQALYNQVIQRFGAAPPPPLPAPTPTPTPTGSKTTFEPIIYFDADAYISYSQTNDKIPYYWGDSLKLPMTAINSEVVYTQTGISSKYRSVPINLNTIYWFFNNKNGVKYFHGQPDSGSMVAEQYPVGTQNDVSMEAWVRVYNITTSSSMLVASHREPDGNSKFVVINMEPGNIITAGWSDLKEKNNPSAKSDLAQTQINLKEWVHVVVTCSLSEVKLYLNGVQVAQKQVTGYWSRDNAGYAVLTVNRLGEARYNFGRYDLAMVRVYSNILTDTNISYNYNERKSKFVNVPLTNIGQGQTIMYVNRDWFSKDSIENIKFTVSFDISQPQGQNIRALYWKIVDDEDLPGSVPGFDPNYYKRAFSKDFKTSSGYFGLEREFGSFLIQNNNYLRKCWFMVRVGTEPDAQGITQTTLTGII